MKILFLFLKLYVNKNLNIKAYEKGKNIVLSISTSISVLINPRLLLELVLPRMTRKHWLKGLIG